jgi:Family of unknown function (DUF6049)
MLGPMPLQVSDTGSRGFRAAAVAAAFLLPLLVGGASPAGANSSASVNVSLVSQRPWLAPQSRLGLTVRIDNAGPQDLHGFLLRVGVYDRITSRSDLHASFDGTPAVPASAFTKYFATRRLGSGDSMTAQLNERVATLASLRIATDGGVFPLTIYLYDASGTRLLDSLTTSLIYYPQRPPEPLNVVTVVPLNARPAEGPDGIFHPDAAGRYPLADALSRTGWLTGMLRGLQTSMQTPAPSKGGPSKQQAPRGASRLPQIAVAPSPRMLEEIATLAHGYQQAAGGRVVRVGPRSTVARDAASFLRRLHALAASPRVQTMLTPYAFPDLPTLDQGFDLEQLARQLQAGHDDLQSTMGAHASWLLAPGGRLDAPTLDDLRLTGAAAHAVVSHGSLQQTSDPAAAGCPSEFATFACPIRMRSQDNSSIGFEADQGLQQRVAALARSGDDPLDVQRFLAETAMIQAETPGLVGRVIETTTPPLWHPRGETAVRFFESLSKAPWLRTVTPQTGLRLGQAPVNKRLVAAAGRPALEPPTSYFAQVSSAQAQVEHYASTLSVTAHPPQLLDRLRQDILVAQSRLWWGDPSTQALGASYASLAQSEATQELHKVTIGGVNEISMTSQRAQIPFVLSSRADHPVRVDIHLFSPKLSFDRSQLTGIVVHKGTQQIAVQATAQASGIFPVEVSVETSDGYVIAKKSIQIRSTNFNQIALGLTLGALLFLVIFYTWSAIRKRRERAAGRPAGTSAA